MNPLFFIWWPQWTVLLKSLNHKTVKQKTRFVPIQTKKNFSLKSFFNGGRYRTWTCDPLNVVQMRYQLRQTPNYIILNCIWFSFWLCRSDATSQKILNSSDFLRQSQLRQTPNLLFLRLCETLFTPAKRSYL